MALISAKNATIFVSMTLSYRQIKSLIALTALFLIQKERGEYPFLHHSVRTVVVSATTLNRNVHKF